MAFIAYIPTDEIPEADRVDDDDNIIRISSVHSRFLKRHHDLYFDLMVKNRGSLTRIQRELIAVVVSAANGCHY
ncbi:carboxymuconolactone decarboxylase family protein [Candidatus Neomarinimicrobiota bacterium]